MAINKKKASPIVRIGIWVISAMLILSFTLPLLIDSLGNNSGSGSTTTSDGKLDAAATQYGSTVTALEQQLASEPTSYTVLTNLGNTYFDWAMDADEASPNSGASRPMWNSAVSYYDRALEVQPGDPNVTTDAAIAKSYSGDMLGAATLIDTVLAGKPDLVPAYFYGALIYESVGRGADAAAAAKQALVLDPEGEIMDVAAMNDLVTRVSAPAAEATTTP